MTAGIRGTIGLALLAAGWIGAVAPGRALAAPAARPAAARPATGAPEAAQGMAAARLRAGALDWIRRAAAYQRRG
ncbi:hypothetical protein GXW74_12985 [Roseomonas eburnea]|uniref:Uncharacterized protein n=1 Tax=Neoroseomonas eburnea TaxID=1346889 RepID=A0A9X9XCG8_9PROT|nr:hypothetical protein [Neoroseomonas eburnea]MBR0681404.1 hypothetical protein [Neoroseomonas eburnea]